MVTVSLSLSNRNKSWLHPLWCSLFVLVCGVIYVSQYWSPSSYGTVLRQIGLPNSGLVFGKPREIRSDEWSVVTPLTQATVNNSFERVNKTSFYKEDLRINYGLPIYDWGLIFKPTMWPYMLIKPARAYSFHWFAILALFLVGHALLFAKLGVGHAASIFLAVGLYYTGFSQFWWNEKGPVFALFPWAIWVLFLSKPWVLRLALFYWISVSWLITNFYPPIFISLAFVGAIILLAFGREWLQPKRLLALLITTVLAGGTAGFYLFDYLRQTASTVYPGHRSSNGGGVPWTAWFSQIFPFNTFDWKYQSVIGWNICEVGCAGTAFLLMMICFLDYRDSRISTLKKFEKRQFLILGAGLFLMNAWMLVPLPSWVGMPLLWNKVQPWRMMYAAGLLLALSVALLGKSAKFTFSSKRMTIYVAVVVVGWVTFKGIGSGDAVSLSAIARRSNDLIVVPVLLIAITFAKIFNWKPYTVILGASAASGAIALLYFNPIQSALPIFSRHDTPEIRAIDEQVQGPEKMLAISGLFGAVANGLGYSSVSHVTPVPSLDFWRQRYPVMPEDEFLAVFNRYTHIELSDNLRPETPFPDRVKVPLRDFWPNRVDVPSSSSSPQEPLWFHKGELAEGRVVVGRMGSVDSISIRIGTGGGQSDGNLQIRVCTGDGIVCATGSRLLASALDNSFLLVKLSQSVELVEANEPLRYEIRMSGGVKPVAFWTRKNTTDTSLPLQINGVSVASSPQFQINFK